MEGIAPITVTPPKPVEPVAFWRRLFQGTLHDGMDPAGSALRLSCLPFGSGSLAHARVVPASKGLPAALSREKGAPRVQVSNPATADKVEKIFATSSVPIDAGNSEDYRIAPLDVVEITVFGVPDLTRTVQVSSSGTVTLPLIKTVQGWRPNFCAA